MGDGWWCVEPRFSTVWDSVTSWTLLGRSTLLYIAPVQLFSSLTCDCMSYLAFCRYDLLFNS
jgi:hypothetical protein